MELMEWISMKKITLAISISAILLFCGCEAVTGDEPAYSAAAPPSQTTVAIIKTPEPTAPTPTEIPGPNAETINSLIERMQSNKDTNSVEGFTGESTVIDAADKISVNYITGASLAYRSKLLGYPAVVKYNFSYSNDMLPLTSMVFYIIPEQRSEYQKQLKRFAKKLKAELGDPGGDYPNYRWESDSDNYQVILSSDGSLASTGILANVNVSTVPFRYYDLPDIFPDIVSTDIETIYKNETPEPGLEELTRDASLYTLTYIDKGIPVGLFFEVRGTEIKLCRVQYDYILPDTGDEDMDRCFKSLGDSMEEIFGPAASRDDSSIELTQGDPPQKMNKFHLDMTWPGLKLGVYYVYNNSSDKNYYVDIIFWGQYFSA